jgi:hypothetical protein
MATINFEFPVWFNATPLKHNTPKMVRGIFCESFEVNEVDDHLVKSAMRLIVDDVINEFVEIGGRFYHAIGDSNSDAVNSKYSAARSPIPGLSMEYLQFDNLVLEKARESRLPLFPKQSPIIKGGYPMLKREWFSDTDLQWIDKRKEPAIAFLGKLRCAGGQIYQPISEPMYAVNLATDRDDNAQSISIEFKSSASPPLSAGYPVAFFRVDQRDEALAYANDLANRHSVPIDRVDERDILIHDSSGLLFDPYRQQILEAASLVMIHNYRHVSGDKAISSAIRHIIGSDSNDWRDTDHGAIDDDSLLQLEQLVRKSLLNPRSEIPPILLETLLERWDDRPIDLSSPKPNWLGGPH